jgi:MFS family permease
MGFKGAEASMPRNRANTIDSARATGPWWQEMTGYHWWVLLVATLGWLFDSMDQRLFVLARTPALRELLPGADDAQVANYAGYATAIFILGWATGGLVFGLLGDRWGRTRTMMVTILLYALFTGLSALAVGWWDFVLYRFLCGMGIGGEYAAGVALVAEVMPDRARPYCLGLLQGLAALGQVAGSAVSLAIGPQAEIGGGAGWRWLFGVGIFPSLLVVVIRFSLREPESWLRARQEASPGTGSGPPKQLGDLGEILRDRRWRYHTIIGMTLGAAGQIGLWGIGFWTPELIRGALLESRRQGVAANHTTEIAAVSTATVEQWKAEEDHFVALGTLLQDLAGMVGIYAFTLATARLGRRWTFAIAYLLALGATLLTFGRLREAADVYWMIPVLGFCVSSVYGGFAIYFPELYPTRLRSTGTAFCYNVARYVTALGPLTLGKLTLLYASLGHGMPLRPAAMTLAAVYLVGVLVLPLAPETRGKPLPE